MKKLIFVLAVLVLALGCGAALAEKTYKSAGFEYALLPNGDAELIRYLGDEGTVIIPNGLDGHPITSVRTNPFLIYKNNDISSYATGVKNCAVSVSTDHPYLATINGVLFGMSDRKLIYCPPVMEGEYTIRQGILEIGKYAFAYCNKLTSIKIPDSVKRIGDAAFIGCSSISAMTIPNGITVLGNNDAADGVFEGCTKLTSISIPDSVIAVGKYAFRNCTHLTSVTIPDSVTSIGGSAFDSCSSLTSVTIPDSVTSIESYAFDYCTSLTGVIIPDSVTRIAERTFRDCTSLTSVTIPDSVISIGDRAFLGCTSLTSVTISDSVTSIGEHAFDKYENRTYSPLPSLVITVTPGSYAETWCMENGLQYVATGVTYGDRDDWLD